MRQATESWQEQIGDTGMIPEAVLMEEMKPGGEILRTEPPSISTAGGRVTLASHTEGASIVYQTKQGDGWSDWKLYIKSFASSGDPIRALACRLGYRDSKIVESR